MSKKEELLTEKDLESYDGSAILEVPDYVWVSKNGKLYYPKKTAIATKKIHLEDADAKGYKPSKMYQNMVEKLYEEYKKQHS